MADLAGYLYTTIREHALNGEVRNVAIAVLAVEGDALSGPRIVLRPGMPESVTDAARSLLDALPTTMDGVRAWNAHRRCPCDDGIRADELRPGVAESLARAAFEVARSQLRGWSGG